MEPRSLIVILFVALIWILFIESCIALIKRALSLSFRVNGMVITWVAAIVLAIGASYFFATISVNTLLIVVYVASLVISINWSWRITGTIDTVNLQIKWLVGIVLAGAFTLLIPFILYVAIDLFDVIN